MSARQRARARARGSWLPNAIARGAGGPECWRSARLNETERESVTEQERGILSGGSRLRAPVSLSRPPRGDAATERAAASAIDATERAASSAIDEME